MNPAMASGPRMWAALYPGGPGALDHPVPVGDASASQGEMPHPLPHPCSLTSPALPSFRGPSFHERPGL